MRILPLLRQLQIQLITRQITHPQTFRQLIDIQNLNAVNLRHLIQIVIKRQYRRVHLLRQFQQARIHAFRHANIVVI